MPSNPARRVRAPPLAPLAPAPAPAPRPPAFLSPPAPAAFAAPRPPAPPPTTSAPAAGWLHRVRLHLSDTIVGLTAFERAYASASTGTISADWFEGLCASLLHADPFLSSEACAYARSLRPISPPVAGRPAYADALAYLETVRDRLAGEPGRYRQLRQTLDVRDVIGTTEVVRRTAYVLRGHPDLLADFGQFLPKSHAIVADYPAGGGRPVVSLVVAGVPPMRLAGGEAEAAGVVVPIPPPPSSPLSSVGDAGEVVAAPTAGGWTDRGGRAAVGGGGAAGARGRVRGDGATKGAFVKKRKAPAVGRTRFEARQEKPKSKRE